MAVRSLIRDVIVIYLAYEIIRGYLYHNPSINTNIVIAAILLLIMTLWFLFEKFGILPSLTE